MGFKPLVRENAKRGTLIEVSRPAQLLIRPENLEPWLKALEVVMWSAGSKRAYVSRRGSSIQVTFTWPDGRQDRFKLDTRDRTPALEAKP